MPGKNIPWVLVFSIQDFELAILFEFARRQHEGRATHGGWRERLGNGLAPRSSYYKKTWEASRPSAGKSVRLIVAQPGHDDSCVIRDV